MNEETINYAEYAWRTNDKGQLCPCQSCGNDRMYYGPLARCGRCRQMVTDYSFEDDEILCLSCKKECESENMYQRLKSGETLHVLARRTGKQFSIQPVNWEHALFGYSVLVDGQVQPGYDGLLLNEDTVKDWLNQVEEITEKEKIDV